MSEQQRAFKALMKAMKAMNELLSDDDVNMNTTSFEMDMLETARKTLNSTAEHFKARKGL